MSAEVAKKRGRPKKVIPDTTVELKVEMDESAKKVGTTRAKSTKTVVKVAKSGSGTAGKVDGVKKSVVKAGGGSASTKAVLKSDAVTGKSAPATTTGTTATSKILEQVKEMEAKKAGVPQQSAKGAAATAGKESAQELRQELATKQTTDTSKSQSGATARSNPVSSQQKPASSTISSDPKISAKQPPPPPSAGKPTARPPPPPSAAKPTPAPKPAPKPTPTSPPKANIPLAQLNSTIVSNIATRAGARPNTSGSQQLPKNYKPVARKVTMTIVALPILIVTSYVLYQRLVLGEEKKMLVKPQENPRADPQAQIRSEQRGEMWKLNFHYFFKTSSAED
ncbi:hypothetical protein IFR05_006694 [Cadophora sp. M221]|nr:hypothetical protein IFR05_006694 [Cadophora sp. M221]